ncbi:MAG: putative toxin-antitoxin system toxin component, PIN family [Saprospiraceae bacterium]|uniref:Toxin-antitoxin system toxin component, PIN family n=1 Tax=Candidatus Opimibacter skivensis TaxID=2982028 RepID=A0A9D7SYV9_9BACT|nr:putative toxin-antitoxin system toxin component, PIN family [Candidatus Opimibacter skivensis]
MPANRKLRIILDTNIWISFLISNRQHNLDLLLHKSKVNILFSTELLNEIKDTIEKPKLTKYFSSMIVPLGKDHRLLRTGTSHPWELMQIYFLIPYSKFNFQIRYSLFVIRYSIFPSQFPHFPYFTSALIPLALSFWETCIYTIGKKTSGYETHHYIFPFLHLHWNSQQPSHL